MRCTLNLPSRVSYPKGNQSLGVLKDLHQYEVRLHEIQMYSLKVANMPHRMYVTPVNSLNM
jgi:hypothetical protein